MNINKWIEDDVMKQNKFDILLKRAESCWLFMLDKDLYISDGDKYLLAKTNHQIIKSLSNNLCVKVVIKSYFYTAIYRSMPLSKSYILIFIHELQVDNPQVFNINDKIQKETIKDCYHPCLNRIDKLFTESKIQRNTSNLSCLMDMMSTIGSNKECTIVTPQLREMAKNIVPPINLLKQNRNDGFVAGSNEFLIPSQTIVDSNPTEQISDYFHQRAQENPQREIDNNTGIDLNDRTELYSVIERVYDNTQLMNQEPSSTRLYGTITNSIQNALETISPIKDQSKIIPDTLVTQRKKIPSTSSDDSIEPTWKDKANELAHLPSRSSSASSTNSKKIIKLKPLLDHKNVKDKFYDAPETLDQNESRISTSDTSISNETPERNENDQTHVYEMCSSSIIFEPKANRIQKENLAKRIFSQISNSASKIFIRQKHDSRLNQSFANIEDNETTSEILAIKKTNISEAKESATSPASKLIDKIIIDKEINGVKTSKTQNKNKRKRKLFPIGNLDYIDDAFRDSTFIENEKDETQAKQKSLIENETKQNNTERLKTPTRLSGDITQKSSDTIMSDKTIPLGQLAMLSKNTSISSILTVPSNYSNDEHTKLIVSIENFKYGSNEEEDRLQEYLIERAND